MRLLLLLVFFVPALAMAQDSDTTLTDVLSKGKFSAHTRTFFMSTTNKGSASDYHALAVGAGIGYESPEFYRLRIGVSGFFIYNAFSSDLSKPDPASRMVNRYEVGLFDLTDPSNRHDLDRLEELYIQYRVHRSFLRAGKMILNTPFINPQDGRMRPTLLQGLWTEIREIKNTTIEAGFISHVSPRSTVLWYGVGESIGIYPVGVDESGSRSGYASNVRSDGIALLGISYRRSNFRASAWNTLIDNVSNTALVQVEKDFPGNHHAFYAGIQAVRQDGVGSGGNRDVALRYMDPGSSSNIVGGRIGLRRGKADVNINGTVIRGSGRFLMPREWGRDPFYTFLPRERNEGYASVNALTANAAYGGKPFRMALGAGVYQLPDVRNYADNKYAMPSYVQLNADFRYDLSGFLEGMTAQLLYVYKVGTGQDYAEARNIVNKVDMSNINIIVNYKFETPHKSPKK